MRIEDLRYFIRVYESGSISQTAKEYYITQQGLSRIISSLENELSVKLFRREGKTLVPTPEGEIALAGARAIETAYVDMLKGLGDFSLKLDADKKMEYIIYGTPVMCFTVIPKILGTLALLFPNVQFNVMERDPTEIADKVEFRENSIGIMSILGYLRQDALRLQSGELIFNELYSDTIHVSAAQDSELAGKERVSVEELSQYPLVLHHTEMLIAQTLLGSDIGQLSITHTTNHALVRRIVEKGLAVGLTSDLIEYYMPNDAAAIALDVETRVYYGCVYPKRERGLLSREIERLVAGEFKKIAQQRKTDKGGKENGN